MTMSQLVLLFSSEKMQGTFPLAGYSYPAATLTLAPVRRDRVPALRELLDKHRLAYTIRQKSLPTAQGFVEATVKLKAESK